MATTTLEWVDVLILTEQAVFTVTACGCIWYMWKMRKQFFIALRSPRIGCMMGAAYILRSFALTYIYILELHGWRLDGLPDLDGIPAAIEIILAPASLVAAGAMISWVLRLLVMYDPAKRRKWGRFTTEKRMFRVLVRAYVVLEIACWAAVGVYGLAWVALDVVLWLDILSILAIMVAAAVLGGQLRKVHDICHLSSDAQTVFWLMLSVVVAYGLIFSVPMSRKAFKYCVVGLLIGAYHPMVYAINVRPIRDFLRSNRPPSEANRIVLLPPWDVLRRWIVGGLNINSAGQIACTIGIPEKNQKSQSGLPSLSMSHLHDTALAGVMTFEPLKEAFGEYCLKSLCSESFQFLVDVSEYQESIHATFDGTTESKDDLDFKTFMTIVDEYIRDNSNSEVNIDSSSKKKILAFCNRVAFVALDKDKRENVFLLAEREIAKMLADNLLNKFKVTPGYLEITKDLVFETC